MRRVLFIALFALIFLAGLTLLLYPTLSDHANSLRHEQAVEQYFEAVVNLSEHDNSQMFEEAQRYNEGLRRNPNRFIMSGEEDAQYRGLLDPTGTGIIGTLEIEVIDVHLPIYHGTDEGVLQIGLGHLEGSSLPAGGPGTHTVITGHRGLPSSTLLTNLDRMAIGDIFNIHVLGETLTYRVDQMVIVLPHEFEELYIDPDADYCTLVTCTPYGINTHRLLVRGRRVNDNGEELTDIRISIPSSARVLTGARAALLLIIPASAAIAIILLLRLRRIYGRGNIQ